MMNNFLNDDLIQLISQYSPEVYCLFRLVNKEVKHVVDEVLPSGSREQKIRFLQGAHWCRFKLINQCAFDAWLDALDGVYGKERISGETVERFCRNYQQKSGLKKSKRKIEQKVLRILCKYNRIEYLKEVWNSMQKDESIYCDWMKVVGMLDDVEVLSMMYSKFTKHCKNEDKIKDVIRTAIQGAVDCYQWENISYLLERHPDMKNDEVLSNNSRFSFAAGNYDVFFDDDALQKDRNVVLRAVMQKGETLAYADKAFQRDRQIVLEAVKDRGYALQYADDSLKKDKEIVLAAVKNNGVALNYADGSLKKDKQVVLAAVKEYGLGLEYADDSLKKDKEVVLAAVKGMGWALKYADHSLTKDKEIVLAALNDEAASLDYAHDSIKNDMTFILEAMKHHGYALKYADDSLKKDKDLVLEAVKQHGMALEYADDSLKKDKDLVLAAVKQDGLALEYADVCLKDDKDVVSAAMKEGGLKPMYADGLLNKDKEVVFETMKQIMSTASSSKDCTLFSQWQ